MVAGRNAAKLAWQLSQALAVGIWLVGLGKPVPPLLWQVAQVWSPIVTGGENLEWSAAEVAQLDVDLWQVSHC